MAKFKILSIDGGGIRGVIPATILQYIEETKGKPIAEMFDLLVGTSTGGILAAGLAVQKSKSKKVPKFEAVELLNLYVEQGAKIFERSLWDGITSGGSLLEEKYSAKNLEKLLKQYFGDATLTDVVKPVMITSYDIEARAPYMFKTSRASENPGRNHLLRDVCRATSAAPTYFEPALTPTASGKGPKRALVDGGVFMNNPAAPALVEVLSENFGTLDEILLVSLGTGENTRAIPYKEAKDWGKLGWVTKVIDIMMDGQADTSDFQCRQLLEKQGSSSNPRYFRFDTKLDIALDDIDAANAGNIRALQLEAQQIISDNAKAFSRLLPLL